MRLTAVRTSMIFGLLLATASMTSVLAQRNRDSGLIAPPPAVDDEEPVVDSEPPIDPTPTLNPSASLSVTATGSASITASTRATLLASATRTQTSASGTIGSGTSRSTNIASSNASSSTSASETTSATSSTTSVEPPVATPVDTAQSQSDANPQFPFNGMGIAMWVCLGVGLVAAVIGLFAMRRKHYRRAMRGKQMDHLLFGNGPAVANAHMSPHHRGGSSSPPPLTNFNRGASPGATAGSIVTTTVDVPVTPNYQRQKQSMVLPPPPAMTISPARQRELLGNGNKLARQQVQVGGSTSLPQHHSNALAHAHLTANRNSMQSFDNDFAFVSTSSNSANGNDRTTNSSTGTWLNRLQQQGGKPGAAGASSPSFAASPASSAPNSARDTFNLGSGTLARGNERPWH